MSARSIQSPLDLQLLHTWLRADNVVLGTSNQVSQWTDLSGNAHHFIQATSTKRPLQILNSFNGRPGILADGTDDVLSCAVFVLTVQIGRAHV